MENETVVYTVATGVVILVLSALVFGGMWGCPRYLVWQQSMEGKAELSKAEYSRQIAVCEAKAKMESAELLANAEVKRAEGVSKANQIIGGSLKGHNEYLTYLWITQLEKSSHEVIYVPTEANLPILEANRLNKIGGK